MQKNERFTFVIKYAKTSIENLGNNFQTTKPQKIIPAVRRFETVSKEMGFNLIRLLF